VVAVLRHPEKGGVFPIEERLDLLRSCTAGTPRVSVDAFDGLLVDYLDRVGASVIVRGLRAISDFEYEFQMALMNRRLAARIETVYMMPAATYTYLSSSLVREVAALGGSVEGLVPPVVAERLARRFGPARP